MKMKASPMAKSPIYHQPFLEIGIYSDIGEGNPRFNNQRHLGDESGSQDNVYDMRRTLPAVEDEFDKSGTQDDLYDIRTLPAVEDESDKSGTHYDFYDMRTLPAVEDESDESGTQDDLYDMRTLPAVEDESAFQIFVKTLSGCSRVLNVTKSETVGDVKHRWMVKGIIPPCDVFLVHGLYVLDDDLNIMEYHDIVDSTTITVRGRLKGSMDLWNKVKDSFSSLASSSDAKHKEECTRRQAQWDMWITDDTFLDMIRSRNSLFVDHIRHGIPRIHRPLVWKLILMIDRVAGSNPGFNYQGVSERENEVNQECINCIDVDYLRCKFLYENCTKENNPLRRVIIAYILYKLNFKYIQGLGFLAGVLIDVLDPEEAFWGFVSIMDGWGCGGLQMATIYEELTANGLIELLPPFLDEMLKKVVPKIWQMFVELDIGSDAFVRKWFLSILASFHQDFVLPIWDVVLYEGFNIVVYVAAAIFLHHKEVFVNMDIDTFGRNLNKLETIFSPDAAEVLPIAFCLMEKYPLPASIRDKLHPP